MKADAINLICQLLDHDPARRLQDPKAIKAHPFFQGVDFDTLVPPCKPHLVSEKDTFYFDERLKYESAFMPESQENNENKDANLIPTSKLRPNRNFD